MKFFLNKSRGFTLLEMLVVLMITTLLAALLMQGFIYLTSTYNSIERQQNNLVKESLTQGWMRNSIQGLVSGLYGESAKGLKFAGDQTSIEGISLASLVQDQATPVHILWTIKTNDNVRFLEYSETPVYQKSSVKTFSITEWPISVPVTFSYYSQDQWTNIFPPKSSVFKQPVKTVLPESIKINIGEGEASKVVVIRIAADKRELGPPPEMRDF